MAEYYYVVGDQSFSYLTDDEMKYNALLIASVLRTAGWTNYAIAGALGNISYEGIMNPGQCEVGEGVPSGNNDRGYSGGLGLIQWTKPSGGDINPLLRYASSKNKEWYDGDLQAEYITHADDFSYTYGYWGWLPSSQYPNVSFSDFTQTSTSATDASNYWLYNLERPSNPSASQMVRAQKAEEWYQYILDNQYIPRLDYVGTDTLPYYREYNAYFGYDSEGDWIGLNNCTAYAFGRWNELAGVDHYNTYWPIHDGSDWYSDGVAKGFAHGNIPQLGAAISWTYPNGGHVAIVEEIQRDANNNIVSFTTSNSAFNGGVPKPGTGERGPYQQGYNDFPWFYLETIYMNNLDNGYGSGSFNGFIYHPNIIPSPIPPTPPPPPQPKPTGRMPFIFYLKKRI